MIPHCDLRRRTEFYRPSAAIIGPIYKADRDPAQDPPYSDGMQLIERYDPTIDLIFLDIQMKVLDGLHAAGQVCRLAPDVGIIFLTTLSRVQSGGYQYQAAGYIIKPIAYAR